MAAQYDQIGASFEAVKRLPIVRYGEHPMLARLLADARGRTVLDVACGTGFNARACVRLGASRVVGVDVSAEMIAAARRAEEHDPLGIEYHVGDAAAMPRLGSFDLALAAWLFNYAQTEDELGRMLEHIMLSLAPDGHIAGFTSSPSYYADDTDLSRYGYRLSRLGDITGGARWQITVPLPGADMTIETVGPVMLSRRACGAGASGSG